VVASRYTRDRLTSEVRVFSLGDNVWRNIESFPVVHLNLDYEGFEHTDVISIGCLRVLMSCRLQNQPLVS